MKTVKTVYSNGETVEVTDAEYTDLVRFGVLADEVPTSRPAARKAPANTENKESN